jgi:hypothetical protein
MSNSKKPSKKDPNFQKNLNLLSQSFYDYNLVITTQGFSHPDYSESFAFSPLSLETEEDDFDPGPLTAPPIKAA